MRSAVDRYAVDQSVGLLAPLIVARQNREPHQILRSDRVGIGRGIVLRRVRPHQQVVGVVGGEVIAAGVGIGVMRVERALPGEARSR